jgi:hypothetical protein
LTRTHFFNAQLSNMDAFAVSTTNIVKETFLLKTGDHARQITHIFYLTDSLKSYEKYRVQGNFDKLNEKIRQKQRRQNSK